MTTGQQQDESGRHRCLDTRVGLLLSQRKAARAWPRAATRRRAADLSHQTQTGESTGSHGRGWRRDWVDLPLPPTMVAGALSSTDGSKYYCLHSLSFSFVSFQIRLLVAIS